MIKWRYWFYYVTAYIRHGPQCNDCDRREICKIIKAGTRPCDKQEKERIKELREGSWK